MLYFLQGKYRLKPFGKYFLPVQPILASEVIRLKAIFLYHSRDFHTNKIKFLCLQLPEQF